MIGVTTPESLIKVLRCSAEQDAKEGEYNPAEHKEWMAAALIEDQGVLIRELKETLRQVRVSAEIVEKLARDMKEDTE